MLWNKVEEKTHGKLQQQAEAHYIQNTQLRKDNQLEEEHPDICDEESEERIELFFHSPAKDEVKKNQKTKENKESEHT